MGCRTSGGAKIRAAWAAPPEKRARGPRRGGGTTPWSPPGLSVNAARSPGRQLHARGLSRSPTRGDEVVATLRVREGKLRTL